MGSLFEELEGQEAAARMRVGGSGGRPRRAFCTARGGPEGPWIGCGSRGRRWLRCFRDDAGGKCGVGVCRAERRVIGVLTVPKWQPGGGAGDHAPATAGPPRPRALREKELRAGKQPDRTRSRS